MRVLFLICLMPFNFLAPLKQGNPVTRNAAYYKSKGYQIFPEYGLAIKSSCQLEDISSQMSGDNDLAYGCIQNQNSKTTFVMTQIIVKRVPEGYTHASAAKKAEVEAVMLRTMGGERITFLGQNAVLKSYNNRGLPSRSITLIKNAGVYVFNMSSNGNLNEKFNALTNSIKFY